MRARVRAHRPRMRDRCVDIASQSKRARSGRVDRGTSIAPRRTGAAMNSDRFCVTSAVRASVSDDGLVLLDVQGGLVLMSNPVGARIWQLMEQRQTCVEIAAQLAEDYRVVPERALNDVTAFLTALIARGFVTVVPAC